MNKSDLSHMVASIFRKAVIVLSGLILSLVVLEAGLRLGGFILSSIQESGNLRSIKQKGIYRILCLGESTTAEQYPQLLEQVLNQHNIGVRFSVIDKGKTGINTLFILSRVESYLTEYHPDMVVAMMGSNDKGVKYYEDIPESGTWLFEYCRVYRFGRMLFGHILKKIKREDIYGSNGSYPDRKAKPEDAGTVSEKPDLSKGTPAEKTTPSDLKDVEGTHGPRSSYMNGRRFSSAEEVLGKDVKLDPKNDHACVGLGYFYQERGEFSQAEDSFKEAIKINPENAMAYDKLGWLYLKQGKFAQAEDSYKKAVALNPKNDHAFVGLGRLYQQRGELSQAEDSYRKVIEINPENAMAYDRLGLLYLDQGKFSQAEDSYRKVIEINPENAMAYDRLGWLYLAQGKFSQAEDSYRKALGINPRNDKTYDTLGWLYQERGELSQAEDSFKNAIAITPENERLLGEMSSLYEKMGKPELAKEYAERANGLRSEYYPAITVNNYRKLKEILDRKGIKLVCVQYPMRNVEPLKRIFGKNEGIIFVDNERIFKEALKRGRYTEYFRDMFAGDFGHCTQKGNMLLAQNIADVILREVFNR